MKLINKWSIGLAKQPGKWTWVSGRQLTICKWGIGEPGGEHRAAFMYKRSSNGKRGVFGSVHNKRTGEKHAYICEISKGELIFLSLLLFLMLFLLT